MMVSEALPVALNKWNFEQDASGLTLARAENSGSSGATFSSGGEGFLETDGAGGLVDTYNVPGSNGMWNSGAILTASLSSATSGVYYLRYDFDYDLNDPGNDSGTVLGLMFTDASGTNLAGVVLVCDKGSSSAPDSFPLTGVVSNLAETGMAAVVIKVDLDAQEMDTWVSLTGGAGLVEAAPVQTGHPIHLPSIDQLRFHATGDFCPSNSYDYARIGNIVMASSWAEIATELTVHPLFHDLAVIQRDKAAPVWGQGFAGETVELFLDGQSVGTTVVDLNHQWQIDLLHAADGGISHTLRIEQSDSQSISIADVVFGDVYLAAGQSNMGLLMNATSGYEQEAALANYPLIRRIVIANAQASSVQTEPVISSQWLNCSPSTAPYFIATGYYFAKNIHLQTGVPVGLMDSAWGGQEIDGFLSPSGIANVPELSGVQQYHEQGNLTNLYTIYNAMIAPLVPYALRGAIWYQGEANHMLDGDSYRFKMQALIRGWRQDWNQGNFPFYYVQLPNYSPITPTSKWNEVREIQRWMLCETNCGMAVTIDIGDDANIHPTNKRDVGYRLAQWALAKDFQKEVICSGPLYFKSKIEDSSIRILFDYAESGLLVGRKNGTNTVEQISEGPLENFEIAGSDRDFKAADAWIDADTVVVSNALVANPCYVRYCYLSAPTGSNKLYNAAALPASPFRTDSDYQLVVISGSGTGTLIPGTLQQIVASNAPNGQVFDRWIGAAAELSDVNTSTAVVTMPEHELYLLATYRATNTPAYTLTVHNGFGSGTSQASSILNIEAGASPVGQVFDCWTGDTNVLVDAQAFSTTLQMPATNITIIAQYRIVDSVGDGIADDWRNEYFPDGGDDCLADADPDGDGADNYSEYLSGTSPVDGQSVFKINGFLCSSNTVSVDFSSVSGRRYQLERTISLLLPTWETLFYNITGTGVEQTFQAAVTQSPSEFYRVTVCGEEE